MKFTPNPKEAKVSGPYYVQRYADKALDLVIYYVKDRRTGEQCHDTLDGAAAKRITNTWNSREEL